MNIKLDSEFQSLIPPITPEEKLLLEQSIIAEGCRDALVVWQEKNILLDGHNRLEICNRRGISFQTAEISLADREEAADWIDRNQLGRRNLTPDQMSILRGRRYNRAKQNLGGQIPGSRVDQNEPPISTADRLAKEHGVSPATIKRDGKIAIFLEQYPDESQAIIQGKKSLADVRREIKRKEIIEKLEDIDTKKVKAIEGIYDVIIIDPPWPTEKIERDIAPDQVGFDYPTMTTAELEAFNIPAADNCHVWLWTTHKFLPIAFRLLQVWGLKYVCCFVWHKPGGFQPFGLPQYNCEFALYARKGTPQFIDAKAFPVCFEASRTGHSEKPELFYDVIRRVTAGRRIDIFNRRLIEGFDGWGLEAI